jgi:signal transduction histidine kinase
VFHSYRTKLQAALVLLGGCAIAVTGWQASWGATEALRQATYDRLDAIRETRARQLERYFQDLRNLVQALASDEATLAALEQMAAAWERVPPLPPARAAALRDFYESHGIPAEWFPSDLRMAALQDAFIASNPHPAGAKDLLLAAPAAGPYSAVHARYHPTFHRYQMAFGVYDIFLIGGGQGRILYTVMKEVDLGAALAAAPYSGTSLARAWRRAIETAPEAGAVIQDYTPYVASQFAPAAFVAAPVRRAGAVIGALAIQVSIDAVNQVMNGGQRWREEGLGETGQAYIVGPDNTLRSDLRLSLENPAAYLERLASFGIPEETVRRIQRDGTSVLAFPVNLEIVERVRGGERGTEFGVDLRGAPVLRSHAPLDVGGLNWVLIAEIESSEALAAVGALRHRILIIGLAVAAAFLLAAWFLGGSVTRPVLAVAAAARRLGQGDLGARIQVHSSDEIGQLAADFNRMAEDLQRTTVSKRELEILAGRLITAQEDERRRVARELHDDLSQRLAAVAIEAGRLQKLPPEAAGALRAGIERLKEQIGRLSGDVHGLSRRLHPALLDDLGLAAAVEAEARAFHERGGPPVNIRVEGDLEGLNREVQLALYRIVQEALRNVQRHADAGEVTVSLARRADAVELRVRDDGRGFDRSAPGWQAGLGLASMEERARLLGGRFQVESSPGAGAVIQVSLPL